MRDTFKRWVQTELCSVQRSCTHGLASVIVCLWFSCTWRCWNVLIYRCIDRLIYWLIEARSPAPYGHRIWMELHWHSTECMSRAWSIGKLEGRRCGWYWCCRQGLIRSVISSFVLSCGRTVWCRPSGDVSVRRTRMTQTWFKFRSTLVGSRRGLRAWHFSNTPSSPRTYVCYIIMIVCGLDYCLSVIDQPLSHALLCRVNLRQHWSVHCEMRFRF